MCSGVACVVLCVFIIVSVFFIFNYTVSILNSLVERLIYQYYRWFPCEYYRAGEAKTTSGREFILLDHVTITVLGNKRPLLGWQPVRAMRRMVGVVRRGETYVFCIFGSLGPISAGPFWVPVDSLVISGDGHECVIEDSSGNAHVVISSPGIGDILRGVRPGGMLGSG